MAKGDESSELLRELVAHLRQNRTHFAKSGSAAFLKHDY